MDSLPRELEIMSTEDGSPTICFSHSSGQEKMHNSKGALSETLYIYGHGLARVFSSPAPARVISVGLGLAYCEMIAFALALREHRELTLWSFETFDYLSESLRHWLTGDAVALSATYDAILLGVSQKVAVSANLVRTKMFEALSDGSWQLRGEFPQDLADVKKVNCVLFDAYSSKTSPQLWNEETLQSVFADVLSEDAVFVTYAATGSLNRALRFLNFNFENRPGFGGKRESTLAIRGNLSGGTNAGT